MSVASRAILSNFFGEQGRKNHPQYLSALSRALFATTILKTAVYQLAFAQERKIGLLFTHATYQIAVFTYYTMQI